jgi:hypothetical protein
VAFCFHNNYLYNSQLIEFSATCHAYFRIFHFNMTLCCVITLYRKFNLLYNKKKKISVDLWLI